MISANSGKGQKLKSDLKGLEIFYSDASSIGSADTFHKIVHSTQFSFAPRELKINWDRLEPGLSWFEGHI